MRRLIGTAILVLSPALALLPITHGSRPASAERPNLAAIFNGDCQQIGPDQFGTVSRAAFDGSEHRIGVQIDRYDPDSPNRMTVEMTYLEPDAQRVESVFGLEEAGPIESLRYRHPGPERWPGR
jgi:hypothetical protein